MAVLIKGMEMPVMCSECDFCGGLICPDNIYTCDCPADGIHGANITRAIEEDCRHPNCPLIEIPEPHGRLIDGDNLPWRLANWPFKCASYEDWEKLCDGIADAPTIIPASEGET